MLKISLWGGTIIGRINKNNEICFYDLDNIREVGYQDLKEFTPVKYGHTSPKDNISQPDNIVNNSSMQNSEKNTKTKQLSISNSSTYDYAESMAEERNGSNVMQVYGY